MSVLPAPCPPSDVLEGIALGLEPSPPLREHLEACADCRQSLGRMREDNRFLTGFAVDGGLLAGEAAEKPFEPDIPGYHILREIHRGGQGVVFQALQTSTKREVAIKIMKQGPFATLADRARFDREVETLGKLNHPNIVAVHDAGVVAGFHYFVMNYVDGQSLDQAIMGGMNFVDRPAAEDSGAPFQDRRPASRVTAILHVFLKVCDAVHAAHLRGIIHRDLKPSNIRVDRSGQTHVLDFGLAKPIDAKRDSAMTQTGQFIGSLPWASPEQVEGASSKIDLRTDVYSLGAILYQLLTGNLPFDVGSNLREAFDNILFREPHKPSAIVDPASGLRIDDELDTIVLKCLSKDRERRYQSAGEIARDLRRYLACEPIEAKRDSAIYVLRKTLRRYRLRVAAAGAFVFLLAAFGVVMSILYQHSARLEQEAVRSAVSLAELLSRNHIEQGRMAGMLGNMQQAEELLWRELLTHREAGENSIVRLNDPPGPPEAYWALWEVYRQHPCLRTLTPAPVAMRTLTVADDQKSLWTADRDGFVQKLDEFGARLDSYRVAFPNLSGLPFVDASGNLIFKFDTQRHVVWRRETGDRPVVELLRLANADAGGICLSPGGRRMAGLIDGKAIVWNTNPFAEAAQLVSDVGGLTSVAISHDDARLAGRDRVGGIHVWDIDSKRQVAAARVPGNSRETIHNLGALVFSQDDRHLADGWEECPGRIWDLTHDPPTFLELSEHPGTHQLQCFSPDGSRLAVGDLGGSLHIFDTQTGEQLSTFVAHSGRIRSVTFTADGRGIWTCGGTDLRLWEVAENAGERIVRIDGESFHSVAISPDGRTLAAGGALGSLHHIDMDTLAVSTTSMDNGAMISCIAVSPDGKRTAAATYGKAALLWDARFPNRPPMRLAHPHYVGYACFSPDGARLATACEDWVVRIWRCDDGVLERELRNADDRVPQVAFDPRGGRLAAVLRNGAMLMWNLDSGTCEKWASLTQYPLRAVQFSPDGRWLFAAGADRVVEIWDASLGRRVATLVGHNQEIYCLDVSNSGEWIASGDSGGVIRLWHAALRRPLATLDGHSGSVMALRFTPDGRSLVSASIDGTLRVWDLTYYTRHIAGNFATQFQRIRDQISADPAQIDAWRRWAGLNPGRASGD